MNDRDKMFLSIFFATVLVSIIMFSLMLETHLTKLEAICGN